ncbi:pentapeptide repeat-containing protein [Mesorhizobium sp. BR-1-1-10]|uniref:pentapeptide repeat-containing protein n=1 Tax=Mesorhizobium sp. BR-1-1-10 TaxID=2876660 RepID=UPI001CD0557A|nr:pentapeptide repeat-containing protein [Mesorhizobium sp. BR-1-1-10]MBZ9975502.1 pentapeptide repeat-containing protein [Mesorhizobium sp. BR-1-1-10]
MKFDIKHRFSGEVIFTAEINCADDASYSLKLGLAVRAAVSAQANLSEANLSWANLSEANLSWANLSEANLSEANLRAIKHDIWGVLLNAIPEVPALRQALIDGKVNGSTYSGQCACLCGTIANVRGCSYNDLDGIEANSGSAAERFFLAIRTGDTPEKNQPAKLVVGWIDEFMGLIAKARS